MFFFDIHILITPLVSSNSSYVGVSDILNKCPCKHESAVCRHDSAVFRHDSAVLRHDSVRCRHDSAVCRHESAVRRYDSNFNLSVIAIFLVL